MNEKSTWRTLDGTRRGTGIPMAPENGYVLNTEDGEVYLYTDGVWTALHKTPEASKTVDPVNNPSHYTRFKGIEVIQLTEHLNFCRGNAVKYIARAGAKDDLKEIEDLEKAVWYIQREIKRIKDNVDE